MVKFSTLYFMPLPNAAHYSFFRERFSPALAASGDSVKTALEPFMPAFNDWLAKETSLIEWQRASEFTKQIADADHTMDHDFAGMKAHVRAALYGIDAEIAASAHRLDLMFRNYGDVAHKPYESEIGDMAAILARLTGDLASDVQTVYLSGWVPKLQADFAAFNALFNSRNAQNVNKPALTFREARQGIEELYHQMTAIADAGALLNQSPQFAAFIDGLNPEIDYLNAQYHHTAKIDLSNCQPDPIPAQSYTGSQITPTPKVFLTVKGQNVELTDGRDFYFEYKDNVKVGNAECTVHARGGYKGTKTVTFVIHPAT